jgi:hypothetical protein
VFREVLVPLKQPSLAHGVMDHVGSRRALELALRSDDPDISTFATEMALIGAARSH